MTAQQKTTLIWVAAGGVLALLAVGRGAHGVLAAAFSQAGLHGLSGFEAALFTTASGVVCGLLAFWLGWPPGELSERLSTANDSAGRFREPVKVPSR